MLFWVSTVKAVRTVESRTSSIGRHLLDTRGGPFNLWRNWKAQGVQSFPGGLKYRPKVSVSKGEISVNPSHLRFSQRTAGGGKPPRAPFLRQQMQGGWDPSKGPVDVIKTEKGLVSFDNTRVAIAQEFKFNTITARVHKFAEPLPPGFAQQRGLIKQAKKLRLPEPQTWGDALRIRTKKNSY